MRVEEIINGLTTNAVMSDSVIDRLITNAERSTSMFGCLFTNVRGLVKVVEEMQSTQRELENRLNDLENQYRNKIDSQF